MDTKDFISPPSLKFNKQDFEIDNAYGAVWGMNILAGELPDEILKIMLGLDIGSIFVGSVFSVYACCAIHVILSDGASVIEVNADISLKDRTAENIVINECSFED